MSTETQNNAPVSAEPVVWVAADTLNSPHPTCISSLAYMSQLDQALGREYMPFYAAPVAVQAQQDADKKDAEQWISVNERLPEIHEWRAGSIAGISDAVLTIDEDDPDTMTVQRLRKGGQGDLTTLYWDNGDSPTHWRSAPSLPGINAARKEQA